MKNELIREREGHTHNYMYVDMLLRFTSIPTWQHITYRNFMYISSCLGSYLLI